MAALCGLSLIFHAWVGTVIFAQIQWGNWRVLQISLGIQSSYKSTYCSCRWESDIGRTPISSCVLTGSYLVRKNLSPPGSYGLWSKADPVTRPFSVTRVWSVRCFADPGSPQVCSPSAVFLWWCLGALDLGCSVRAHLPKSYLWATDHVSSGLLFSLMALISFVLFLVKRRIVTVNSLYEMHRADEQRTSREI